MKPNPFLPSFAFALSVLLLSACGDGSKPAPVDPSKAWVRSPAGHWVSNPAFARRVLPDGSLIEMPPRSLASAKPAGGLRVGVFGGAAAAGTPAPYVNLAGALDAVLQQTLTNRVVEVADATLPGLSADEVAGLIRQSVKDLGLDVVVLYPDTAHGGASPTGGVSKLSVRAPMSAWIAAARESGAKAVLCIPGANLADWAPVHSAMPAGADAALRELSTAAEKADWDKVLELAGPLHKDCALAAFLKGKALQAKSDFAAAAEALALAAELDLRPLRFPPSTHTEFEALAGEGVAVVNANLAIGKSLYGIYRAPGGEAFETESLLSVPGLLPVAQALAAEVAKLAGHAGELSPAQPGQFLAALGQTDILTLVTSNRILEHLGRPEYAAQWDLPARRLGRMTANQQAERALNGQAATALLPDRVREQLAKRPDDLRLRDVLVLHLAGLNQLDPALAELDELARRRPGSVETGVMRCRLLSQMGRNEEALAQISAVTEWMPGWEPAELLRLQLLIATGKAGEAVSLLEPLRGKTECPPARLALLASAQLSLGKTNEAAAVYAETLQLHPRRVDLILAAAELAIQRARVDEAMALLQRAREAAPNAPEVDEAFAVLFGRMRDFPRSIALLERAAATAPGRARTAQLLTEARTLQDKLARELFEKAGQARGQGDDATAVQLFREALKMHPAAPPLLENLSFVLSTSPNDSVRNGAEALRLARIRLEQLGANPTPEASATLAAALAETGDFAGAVAEAERALALGPKFPGFKPGRIQEALAAYRKSTCWRAPRPAPPR